MNKFTFIEAVEKLKNKTNYTDIYKTIFMWVKQDKINPAVMESLIIHYYKIYSY